MGKVMLVGPAGAGKTSLIFALSGDRRQAGKTQCIEFYDQAIDTPGEYAQIPRFYPALLVTAAEAGLVLLVQDATSPGAALPPGFAALFFRPVAGVVTKIDHSAADGQRARERLADAGVREPVFFVSAFSGEGVNELFEYLTERGCVH